MTVGDAVLKLIGPVRPVGCTHEDTNRYNNLKDMIIVLDTLIEEISVAARSANSQEASVKQIGKLAERCLQSLKED